MNWHADGRLLKVLFLSAATLIGVVTMLGIGEGRRVRNVDLRNTPGGQEALRFLEQLAQGNERDAGLDVLELDPVSAILSGKGWIRHRQVSGTIWVPEPTLTDPMRGERKPIVAYDWTNDFEFAFNVRTKEGHAVINLGHGRRLDTRKIQRILDGDVMALLEFMPVPKQVYDQELRNEYEEIRETYYRKHGGERNVYFASYDFVRWATPERAGDWIIRGIATGPAAFATAMKEVQRKSLQEADEVGRWLQQKGVQNGFAVAEQLLSGRKANWPFLSVKWQTVGFYSQKKLVGYRLPEGGIHHAAFVLVWREDR
ncbi:MAG: hypothetical protein HY913_14890 [Desulfomonile tiedjei]|nr:hypothetical protein [Desulfomonile tiedjei]